MTRDVTTVTIAQLKEVKSLEWLLFVYRMPPEPSRDRVRLWRELKRLGALHRQQSLCMLPKEPHLDQALRALSEKVQSWGGQAEVFATTMLDSAQEVRLIEDFRALRNKDYQEILEQCEAFFQEIEYEVGRQNFTSAEVEEIEEDLERLKRWFQRVKERDWFNASSRAQVEAKLTTCEAALEEFTAQVLEVEDQSTR